MASYRIGVLMHKDLEPVMAARRPMKQNEPLWRTEYDVVKHLRGQGHEVAIFGVDSDIGELDQMIGTFRPDIIFNLLEEFRDRTHFDQHIVSYLELRGVAYTGCNPRGLMLARDKALAKQVLTQAGVSTPGHFVVPIGRPLTVPEDLAYPLIVKCLREEASLGLSRQSVVRSEEKLLSRIAYMQERYGVDLIVEQFVAGSEYFVGVLGNDRLTAVTPLELRYQRSENADLEVYGANAKFSDRRRATLGIDTGPAELPNHLERRLINAAKNAYRALSLSGYARMDFRVDPSGAIFLLEANPNPDVALNDDFAKGARLSGLDYPALLERIVHLGISWSKKHASHRASI